jgi:hypothetical protein
VIACSTVHSVGDEHTIIRSRRRPQSTSTNGSTVRKIFGDQARKDLPIPVFIDDYNHYMGGVDIADQLRSYYSTQRIFLYCWFSLFFWILDSAILNAYLLGKKLHGSSYIEYKDFREVLWSTMFKYSKNVYIQRKLDQSLRTHPQAHSQKDLQAHLQTDSLADPQADPQADLQAVKHRLISSKKRARCINCQIVCSSRKRKFGDEIPINRKGPRQTSFVCNICNVPLCKESNCWTDYQS